MHSAITCNSFMKKDITWTKKNICGWDSLLAFEVPAYTYYEILTSNKNTLNHTANIFDFSYFFPNPVTNTATGYGNGFLGIRDF